MRPVTVIGEAAPVTVWPPGLTLTVYWVMGEPPLAGAVKLTEACVSPAVALTFVGLPGTTALTDGDRAGVMLAMPSLTCTVKLSPPA